MPRPPASPSKWGAINAVMNHNPTKAALSSITSSSTAASSTTVSAAAAAAAATATAATIRANFPLALALSSLAGASTGLGALLCVWHPSLTSRSLGEWQAAAAGFMLAVSLDLVPAIRADLDAFPALVFAASGAAVFALLAALIPDRSPAPDRSRVSTSASHPDKSSLVPASPGVRGSRESEKRAAVLWSGLLTAATISLHNFPEGVAVCFASLRGLQFGLPLAIAIGLHNIPEGMAVALPLYYATGDRYYAVRIAFLSGMAEPAGVLFVLVVIHFTAVLTRTAVAAGMAAVAGIMVVLSFAELIPHAVRHAGRSRAAAATICGFVVMTLLLRAIEALGLGV